MEERATPSTPWILSPVLLAVLLSVACQARTPPPTGELFPTDNGVVRIVTFSRGLEHPWGLAFLADGRMLVTERPGRLRIVDRDGSLSTPVVGLPEVKASGQGGLLDVALAPDFEKSGLVYLSYSEPGKVGSGTAVGRGKLVGEALERFEVIFSQEPKTVSKVHYGSRLVFSRDGLLYVTLGERGERELAQDLSVNRGQVIRISPDGSVPEDNPYFGHPVYRPEVWSYGHRNPQGAALDPATGDLWTVEHGAKGGDEINIPGAGLNYGWPVITYGVDYTGLPIGVGTHKEGMEQPVHYWDPSIAPSGMAFYTGDRFPEWKGNLFVGALKGRILVRLTLDGSKVTGEERMFRTLDERIRDVRQGPDGYIYLLTDSENGRILRLEPGDSGE